MLEKVKLNQSFRSWPPHLTLVPWFELSGNNIPEFLSNLEAIVSNLDSITLTPTGNAYFGPRGVEVTLIKPTAELVKLHHDLMQCISDCDAVLLNERYVGKNFRPHVTIVPTKPLSQLSRIIRKQIYLVAKGITNDRQVVHIIKFGERKRAQTTVVIPRLRANLRPT